MSTGVRPSGARRNGARLPGAGPPGTRPPGAVFGPGRGGLAPARPAPLFDPAPPEDGGDQPAPGAPPAPLSAPSHDTPTGTRPPEPPDDDRGAAGSAAADPSDTPRPDTDRAGTLPDPAHQLTGPGAYAWLLIVGVVTVVGHLVAAARAGVDVATLGESRLAVATAVARGVAVVPDPLPLSDRFAAVQLAALQALLPVGGLPLVEAGRWTCLAVGAVTALLVWPVARGLRIPPPAAAVGVTLVGASLPALALHSGLGAAVVAAFWLTLAVACVVRGWRWAAVVAAALGVLTTPLAAAALLALGAHLVLNRTVRPPDRFRLPIGGALGTAAVVVAVLAVADGPLAGAAGPEVSTPIAAAVAAMGLLVLVLAGRVEAWLRPVLAATALLFVVALVPGPSRAAALVLVVPVLALAAAALIEPVGARFGAPVTPLSAVLVGLLIVPLAVPVAVTPSRTAPTLLSWITAELPPDVPVRADALDRAELVAAGFPVQRLRGPDDPVTPGELVLVTERPTDGLLDRGPARCTDDAVVAGSPRGTGGAPAVVCRTDGGGVTVAAERPARARLGSDLAGNPSLQLAPAAAAALRDGAVDPRLMLVLAAMAGAHRITVDDFPSVGFDAPDVPLRRVLLGSVDGTSPATSELLATWLSAQQPPFVPADVRPQGTGLLVSYPVPPPGGLLPG